MPVEEIPRYRISTDEIRTGALAERSVLEVRITAKSNLDRFDLHRLKSNALVANYSSAQGNELFGMAHSANDPIDRLAIRFASTYPQIVDVCNGADPLYADWLAELQAHAESKLLPVAYADGLTYSRDSVALLDECGAVRSLCPLKFD